MGWAKKVGTAGTGGGRRGKRSGLGEEARRRLVAEMLLKRMTVREISAAMAKLPARKRPACFSSSAIGRDVKVLREEWALARAADVEQHVSEEVARLNELERVWWPKALDAEPVATDKVLAIQRQRAGLLGAGIGGARGRVSVAAGQKAGEAAQAATITVEWVDDWRDSTPLMAVAKPEGGRE